MNRKNFDKGILLCLRLELVGGISHAMKYILIAFGEQGHRLRVGQSKELFKHRQGFRRESKVVEDTLSVIGYGINVALIF